MRSAAIWWLLVVAAASRLSFLHASSPPSTTVPAFLWSPHHPHHHRMTEVVNYQTISSKDLARSVLSEGGWSNLLCSEKKVQQSMDLALVFVGRGLLSTDVSTNKNTDSALVNLLKVSYTKSNFSMAFPYVAASEEAMENSLVSGFAEACGQDLGTSNVAFSESCSVEGENFQKLANLHAINVNEIKIFDAEDEDRDKNQQDHTRGNLSHNIFRDDVFHYLWGSKTEGRAIPEDVVRKIPSIGNSNKKKALKDSA
ncbi:hypothetical protein OIU84_012255 [Salix udensis]|uniref:Uncharacterized protein n=1 Tax=Salix udensis TaxID=889485 RepID=A0AAD6NT34_9ROSI|nr:hypothetical protein OIU84_012255 [Salix udensis]